MLLTWKRTRNEDATYREKNLLMRNIALFTFTGKFIRYTCSTAHKSANHMAAVLTMQTWSRVHQRGEER